MDDDELFELQDTIGKVLGFAYAAALREGPTVGSAAGLRSLAGSLQQLCESESFTPDVSIVLGGMVFGIMSFVKADPDSDDVLV